MAVETEFFERTVFVKAEDIITGMPKESDSCPIALALRRMLPDPAADVEVETSELSVGGFRLFDESDQYKHYIATDLPSGVAVFIDAFDQGLPVQPFSFTVTFREDEYW